MPLHPDARTEAIGFKVTGLVNAQIRHVAASLNISVTELLNRIWAGWYAERHEAFDKME